MKKLRFFCFMSFFISIITAMMIFGCGGGGSGSTIVSTAAGLTENTKATDAPELTFPNAAEEDKYYADLEKSLNEKTEPENNVEMGMVGGNPEWYKKQDSI